MKKRVRGEVRYIDRVIYMEREIVGHMYKYACSYNHIQVHIHQSNHDRFILKLWIGDITEIVVLVYPEITNI